MRTGKGRENINNSQILLDSGFSSTIIIGKYDVETKIKGSHHHVVANKS